jgi:hypothetical protein
MGVGSAVTQVYMVNLQSATTCHLQSLYLRHVMAAGSHFPDAGYVSPSARLVDFCEIQTFVPVMTHIDNSKLACCCHES